MERRDFLKSSLAIGAMAYLRPASLLEAKGTPIGIQLWSVRDALAVDAKGTLAEIAKQGYQFVEGFGFKDGGWFGLEAKEFKSYIASISMQMPTCHYVMTTKSFDKTTGQLSDEFKRVVDAGNVVGQKYLINPYMIEEERNAESVKMLCEIFNRAGEYCKKQGIRFGYHNHAFELEQRIGTETMYKYLLDNTEASLVTFEMDMGWVVRGKYNPIDWFKLYPGRFELSHMKDMVNQKDDISTYIGNGIVDFKQIIANKKLAGMKYWIVEIEHYRTTSVQEAGACYKELRRMIV
jgi:sugar phosphate isomerase/epimerase